MAIKKRVSRQLNNGSGFNKIEDIRNTKISKDNLVTSFPKSSSFGETKSVPVEGVI